MASSIQSAVNSMIGSAAAIQSQRNENIRKAASIAIGAVTGGLGGAAMAAAKQAGIDTKPIQQFQQAEADAPMKQARFENLQSSTEFNQARTAAIKARQSMQSAQEEKKNRSPIYGARGELLNG